MRIRIDKKHLGMKYKLIYLILIISILVYMALPIVIPINSAAKVGDTGDGYVETEMGKIVLRSTHTNNLNVGDIIKVEVYIEAQNIWGIVGYFAYDNTVFEELQESDIEINNKNWKLDSLLPPSSEESNGNISEYCIEMSENSNDVQSIGNFTACFINLKVKKAVETTQVAFNNVILTDVNGNDTAGEGGLGNDIKYNLPANAQNYEITYNSNTQDTSVTNIPSADKKLQGTSYTISSTIPTREGYTFKEWNTKSDGTGNVFNPGEIYNVDQNLELFAQWKETQVFDITYNSNVKDNTVKNMPKSDQKTEKVDYKISSMIPTRDKYTFKGWNTKQDGTGATYNPGSMYDIDKSLELYAMWEEIAISEKLYLSSEPYKIGNNDIDNYEVGDKYISRVVKETTLENFKYNLDTNGKIRVLKEDGTELKDGELVGTGMTLEVTKDKEKIELKIAVIGDVSGDGKVTVTDLSTINQTVLGVVKLQNEYKIAADLDENDNITVTDLSTENKMILGLVK